MLLGRKWKVFASDKHGTDNITLPSMNNGVRPEQYIEAIVISTIVDEIMLDDIVSCVAYSNDGLSQSVKRELCGSISYCQQSFSQIQGTV